ncbi:MAG: fimbria major subunit [Tannerellaceae bacterium]|nr:fimbria major subunit [Tannerellaceae bacterium]
MKKLIYGMMIVALFFTACRQDEFAEVDHGVKGEEPVDGEKSTLKVSFSFNGYGTYASTEDEDKTAPEIAVSTPLELYVFSENGPFYGYFSLPLSGSANTYTSEEFKLPKGGWYMYAFVNKPSGIFPQPTESMSYMDFELQKIEPAIASNRAFMGTLLRDKKTVSGGGVSGNPEHIRLKIGHLLSKVNIAPDDPEVKGNLKGSFLKSPTGRPFFTIGNTPKAMYLIGQWDGPFRQLGSQVISPHYYSYDLTVDFGSADERYPYPSMGNEYYTRENTNDVPRYENSSCFLLLYHYYPHADEVHNINHQTGNSTTNETFWVAKFKDGSQLIYNIDPTSLTHPVAGEVIDVTQHLRGECYYRVYIADNSEMTPSLRYATIRNHFYYLTVNSISGFGNYPKDEWEDEEDPLLIDPDIDITIHMQDWIPYEIPVDLD